MGGGLAATPPPPPTVPNLAKFLKLKSSWAKGTEEKFASNSEEKEGGGDRFNRGGGGYPPPPQHSGPDSTPKAFPYPNTGPNRSSNRQQPPPNRFTSPATALQPLWNFPDRTPPLQAKPWGGGGI